MGISNGATGRLSTFFCILFLTVFGAAWPLEVRAIPAAEQPFTESQPDGTPIRLQIRGDERFHWTEDTDGFTVIRNNRWYEYARLNSRGKLVTTGLKVGHVNPHSAGLSRGVLPDSAQRAPGGGSNSVPTMPDTATTVPLGEVRNLVVLIRFSNHAARILPSASEIDVLFNAPGGHPELAPTGSVRDVYLVNSYGQFELNSDVYEWITVSNTEQYYANGASGDSTLWEALREALDVIDQSVDLRDYDNNGDGLIDSIAFIHSGYGAEWGGGDAYGTDSADRIWSHRWAIQNPAWVSEEGVEVSSYHISPSLWGRFGSDIGRIGVIAHETGHFFGLPDLYDVDGGGEGIGSYGMMANPWGFSNNQYCPPHFSPWSKNQLGWINPVEIDAPGEYSLSASAIVDDYLVIRSGYADGEYLMIENRQNAGFDCSLPQGGLAIWHIDENTDFYTEGYPGKRWPRDGKHYRVALAQADGAFNLEKGHNRGDGGDVHHAGAVDAMAPGPDGHPNTDGYQSGNVIVTGHVISDIGPSATVMTFCLNGCGGSGGNGSSGDGGFDAPTNLQATVTTSGKGKNASRTVSLTWTDNSNGDDNEDVFVVERCVESGKGKSKSCIYAEYATVGQDTRAYQDSIQTQGVRYRVKARSNAQGDSSVSNEVRI